ncbi:ORF22 [Duck adenovirus 3]|nr:ORF22 [Duck adenovirus 3]
MAEGGQDPNQPDPMRELERIEEELMRIDDERIMNNRALADIRALVDEIENEMQQNENQEGEDDDLLNYDVLQLMSFENHHIIVSSCPCHNWYMRDFCMSIFSNLESPIFHTVWSSLADDPDLYGCYFISSNMAAMFSRMDPVFMDRRVGHSHGVIINVSELTRYTFLSAVCAIADMGAMPCEYIRFMSLMDINQLLLSCPRWMFELMQFFTKYYSERMSEIGNSN